MCLVAPEIHAAVRTQHIIGGGTEEHTGNSLRVLWHVALTHRSEMPIQISAWSDSMGVTQLTVTATKSARVDRKNRALD